MDPGRFPVHRPPGAHDTGAVGGADALMPQAHAEDRDRRPEAPHDVGRDAGLPRRAGPGGDDDMRRLQHLDSLWRRSVVTSYHGLVSHLAHVAGQIVDERVVVIDQQDQATRAAMRALALSRGSEYSSSGSDSATPLPPYREY